MNVQKTARVAGLYITLSSLVLSGLTLALSSNASASSTGNTGQALLLRAALRSGVTPSLLSSKAKKLFGASPFVPEGRRRNGPDGRFIYGQDMLKTPQVSTTGVVARRPKATGPILLNEAVQTFDVFAPPPAFAPTEGSMLTPTNLTPVWSANESYLIFASNRNSSGAIASDGKFHIWSISVNGGTSVQVTSGSGNEFFPALNSSNTALAFTSDANSAGVQNLYTLDYSPGQTAVDVATLNTATNAKTLRTDLVTGFDQVVRPTWSPGGDRIAFSARTTADSDSANIGRYHIYYLYDNTNGYRNDIGSGSNNPPALLTDGPADDTDPAWSPDGRYIALASTAGSFRNTGQIIGPGTSPSLTLAGSSTNRSIFLITPVGTVANGGAPVTLTGTDDYGPAWSANTSNQYTNPNVNFEYLAFARGATRTSPHDIYYFRLLSDVNNGTITPETSGATSLNFAVKLNTSDAANTYNDIYPTWSPFQSIFSIAYASNRSVTYNAANNVPSETAISVLQGSSIVGNGYSGILQSQVLNLDPPTLLRYNGTEVVHVADASGVTTKEVQPGQTVTVTTRLSDREAGIYDLDNQYGVYMQIKDPDSKYQDSQSLEHKVFAGDPPETATLVDDSGSASFYLYNGGLNGGPFGGSSYGAVGYDVINNALIPQRGAVGGVDGGNFISVGTTGAAAGARTADKPPFFGLGQEYEAQYVDPNKTNPAQSDYGTPYYLAGIDDQIPFSGSDKRNANPPNTPGQQPPYSHPPRNVGNDNYRIGDTSDPDNFPGKSTNEWLKMTRASVQDGQGGVLYTATYKTPTAASDFYVDVIAYDKASFPALAGGQTSDPDTNTGNEVSVFSGNRFNWRIYDNVSGFTTASFDGANDILLVSDNTLGQKFALTTFGGQSGLANVVPTLYGTESYVTDIDVAYLADAVYFNKVVNNVLIQIVQQLGFGPGNESYRVLNGLGVGSYTDGNSALFPDDERIVDDGGRSSEGTSARFSNNKSQKYSIWRILSRGPIPSATLSNYAPTFQNQPSVSDSVNKYTSTARRVPVAQRCVIWLSPYTGDLLVGPGSIDNPTVQTNLRAFVNAGGRLCVSGQDVASTLTNNGIINNGPGSFLYDILNATYSTGNGGTQQLTGGAGRGNRITYDAYFNVNPTVGVNVAHNYYQLTSTPTIVYNAPGQNPIYLGNNYVDLVGSTALWRTDGALDQLGPILSTFSLQDFRGDNPVFNANNTVIGQIDTVKPVNNASNDVTFSGPSYFQGRPGELGLIYKDSIGSNSGRTVFASFGLEGIGIEYYKVSINGSDYYIPRNQRPNILHNIVSYLRTGSFAGRVVDTTSGGKGVAGATVYLIANEGVAIPGAPATRQTFSATTSSSGDYRIDGVEPGAYFVVAAKTGFTSSTSSRQFRVEGDTIRTGVNLNIAPLPAGSISGLVRDASGNPVGGATVTFTSNDGSVIVTATTGPTGTYTIANVPVGTYSGVASKPGFGNSSVQTNIVVNSGQNTPNVNFTLAVGIGVIKGTIYRLSDGAPIAGATVSFRTTSGTVAGSVTTGPNGTYDATALKLPAASYVVTASAPGYAPTSKNVTLAAGATVTVNIGLPVLANGTLGGLVSDGANGDPLSNATVVVIDPATNATVASLPTSATTRTGPDGSPINYSGSVKQGTYNVKIIKGGGYTSKTLTVTIAPNAFTRLDFTGANAPQPLFAFLRGYNFFSVPYDYTSYGSGIFSTIFGPLNTGTTANPSSGSVRSRIAVWSPTLVQYVLDPTPPADALRLGQGYWVYLQKPVGLSVIGTPAGTGPISVALRPSWNMIGVPSVTPINVSALNFVLSSGGKPISFADASSTRFNLIDGTLYGYDTSSGQYQPITGADQLQPFHAYWIRARVPTTVQIPTK